MIFCKKCNHRVFGRFCAVDAKHYIDPITGKEEDIVGVKDYCTRKNKNLACPDFKQRIPWWKCLI